MADANGVYHTIIERLKEQEIAFSVHEHMAAVTVIDAEERLPFPKEAFLKTVVFKIKNGYWILAAVRGQDSVDYRKLAAAFGVKRGDVVRPLPEEVETSLGYEIGGICPIPVGKDIEVVFDCNTLSMDRVYCGSGRNDRTLEIKLQDLLKVTQGRVLPLIREHE